ncbi:MAG TPA: S8 family serine peptidase [Actinomycetes bacterium]
MLVTWRRPRFRRVLVLLSAFALLGILPDHALAASPAATSAARHAAHTPPVVVTLVTGDKVALGKAPNGAPTVSVTPAKRPGRHVGFVTAHAGSDLYVIPSDARRSFNSLFEADLFNVTKLAREGFDDAHAASLPLILQHTRGATVRMGGSLRRTRELSSIHATVVRQDRRRAFATGLGSLSGVTRVWLDGRTRAAALDPNLTQVGAPVAWAAGLDGRGVRVAVLDTGIDATHPDLAGSKVVDQANFSDSPGAGDHVGHGTHVAATIAGTGVASHGARKGVAFAASLLNGKVLDDDGFGTDDQVIAGMEWATAHGAKVVNMSLGSFDATDGTDPVSQALNQLTASSGTLFVVAAGNAGPDAQSVTAPGAADAALTVGAVDVHDRLAEFSSRGPRDGDFAMKPDIVAPGVDIIEARAAGTSLGEPVDQLYTKLSGTSMATPHVAGAAAILRQQHPGWSPAQVKAALEDTAAVLPGSSVYQQGGGRLDIAHAIGQRVLADRANLDFGFFKWPHTSAQRVTKQVSLTNTGAGAVTLRLALDLRQQNGRPAAAGLATLSPSQLTLRAGQSGTVSVTVDATRGTPSLYSGSLTATPDGGGPALHLPVGFFKEPKRFDLHVSALGRDGRPDTSGDLVGLLNVDNGQRFADFVQLDQHGRTTVRVPPGNYSATTVIFGFDAASGAFTLDMAGITQFPVRKATSIVLDARKAKVPSASVAGRATKPDMLNATYQRNDAAGTVSLSNGMLVSGELLSQGGARIQPTARATVGVASGEAIWRLVSPRATAAGDSPFLYDLLFRGPRFPNPPAYHLNAAGVARLARISNHFRSLDDRQPADYQELRLCMAPGDAFGFAASEELTVPSRRVEFVTPGPVTCEQDLIRFTGNGGEVDLFGTFAPYPRAARLRDTWFGAPLKPEALVERDPTTMLVVVNDFFDSAEHDGVFFEFNDPPLAATRLRLYRNHKLLLDTPDAFGILQVPKGRARFQLVRDLKAPMFLTIAPESHTTWSFSSAAPASDLVDPALPQLSYGVRLDEANTAPAGRALRVNLRGFHFPGTTPSSTVRGAKLWFSTNDGRSWTRVRLRGLGNGRFRGSLPGRALAPGSFVSLRATARDRAGATIDQTLIRTFAIR